MPKTANEAVEERKKEEKAKGLAANKKLSKSKAASILSAKATPVASDEEKEVHIVASMVES